MRCPRIPLLPEFNHRWQDGQGSDIWILMKKMRLWGWWRYLPEENFIDICLVVLPQFVKSYESPSSPHPCTAVYLGLKKKKWRHRWTMLTTHDRWQKVLTQTKIGLGVLCSSWAFRTISTSTLSKYNLSQGDFLEQHSLFMRIFELDEIGWSLIIDYFDLGGWLVNDNGSFWLWIIRSIEVWPNLTLHLSHLGQILGSPM